MGFLSPELSGAVPGHNLGGWGMDGSFGWMDVVCWIRCGWINGEQ